MVIKNNNTATATPAVLTNSFIIQRWRSAKTSKQIWNYIFHIYMENKSRF